MDTQFQLEKFIDGLPGGVGIYNIYADGTVELVYINDGYYEMIGDSRENRERFSGRLVMDAVPKAYQEKVKEVVLEAIAGNREFQIRIPNYNTKKEERWLQLNGKIVEHIQNRYVAYVTYTDVTTYEKNTQALAKANTQIQIAATAGGILYWIYDVTKHQTRITNGKGYGYDQVIENVPEVFKGTGDIHPDEEKQYFQLFEEMNQGVASCDCCARIYNHLVDEYQWQHIIFTKFTDKQYIGSSIDITAQKRMEQQYEDEIALRNDLLKDCILFYQVNLTKGVVEESVTNYPELDLQKFFSTEEMLQAWNEGKTHITIPPYQVVLAGTTRMIETTITLIRKPVSGEIIAFSYSRDVTNREINQWISTKLLSEQYEAINIIDCRTMRYALYAFCYNNDVVNRTYSELYIDGLDKFTEKYVYEEDQEHYRSMAELAVKQKELDRNGKYYFSFRLKSQDKEKPVKKMTYFYLETNHHAILSVLEDVTEVSRREKENTENLHAALEKAELATRAKSEFLSRMSHDMRTPMNGILGMAELSEDENEIQVLKENIHRIKDAGDYLLGLINDTLDFQRIESGNLELEPVMIEAASILHGVLDLIKPAAEKKNITFIFDNMNADFSCYIQVDPLRMKQIFINLLSNAVKFTPAGGTITFTSQLLEREGMISHDKIIVSDTGIGMSEEFVQNRLFKPFSQERNEVTGQYAGSGLGLSIVKSLVQLMGGRIEVESELGVGTTFTIYFDFQRVSKSDVQKALADTKQDKKTAYEELKGKNILMAEDHPLNAEIATRLLEKVGCNIQWVENGKECRDVFLGSTQNQYDLILMDIRMPEMDGLKATREIRSLSRPDAKTIPIIAMTANAFSEDIRAALEAGMNAHISKPINPDTMYETMAKYIKNH